MTAAGVVVWTLVRQETDKIPPVKTPQRPGDFALLVSVRTAGGFIERGVLSYSKSAGGSSRGGFCLTANLHIFRENSVRGLCPGEFLSGGGACPLGFCPGFGPVVSIMVRLIICDGCVQEAVVESLSWPRRWRQLFT